jgi:diguanylate cyclase (GGDEF)-like protein/PAS domain S-box-containing protein
MRRIAARLPGRIVPAGVLLAASLLAVVGLTLLDARHDVRQQADRSSVNLVRAIARDLSAEMRDIDLALLSVAGILDRTARGQISPELQRDLIRERVTATRYLEGIAVLDSDGDTILDSRGEVPANTPRLADRDYFVVHQDRPDIGFFVSRPFQSRRTGSVWTLGFSRRLFYADGRFAGIVMGVVRLDRMEEAVFSGIAFGHRGSIALVRQDSVILARSPFDERQVGRDMQGSANAARILGSPSGQFVGRSVIDGVERLYTHRRIEAAPLAIQLAFSTEHIFSPWRRKALMIGAISLLLAVAIVAMAWLLQRELARRRALELTARDSEATFRLLAENSGDMVVRTDMRGRRLYVSPTAETIFGRPVEEMLSRGIIDDVVPEDAPIVRGALMRLRAGVPEQLSTYRIRRPDGTVVWLESSTRTTRDTQTGRIDGVVAVLRDVTERKAAEDRLAALARTDALTGLANRRSFDEALAVEWRRARRDGQPLSLLLLDIDRFKAFNDGYGHPAGDACLRAVAGAIAATVGRPGDMVARYGGEEIALLLPVTAAAGAAAVAEQVRAAIEALGLPHAGNDPAGIVTASLGAATVVPGEEDPAALLAAADAALYQAKRSGRNRAVSAAALLGTGPAAVSGTG